MGIDLAKHVFRPGEGEALAMLGPTSGTIMLLVDPENTGETGFCTGFEQAFPRAEQALRVGTRGRHRDPDEARHRDRERRVLAGHHRNLSRKSVGWERSPSCYDDR